MASIKERMNIFEKRIQSNKVNQNNNNPFQKKLNPSDKINKSNTNTSNKKENNDDFVLKKSQTIAEKNPLVQKLSLNKKEDNQINKKTQDEKYKIEDNKIVNKKEEISKNYSTVSIGKFVEIFKRKIDRPLIVHPKNLSVVDGILRIPAYMFALCD